MDYASCITGGFITTEPLRGLKLTVEGAGHGGPPTGSKERVLPCLIGQNSVMYPIYLQRWLGNNSLAMPCAKEEKQTFGEPLASLPHWATLTPVMWWLLSVSLPAPVSSSS